LNAATGAIVSTLFSEPAAVYALALADFDGDTVLDYVTAAGNALRVRSGVGLTLAWNSGPLANTNPATVGYWDSIAVADVDAEAGAEIVANLGPAGFTVFKLAP
jgi:hypothetical protein